MYSTILDRVVKDLNPALSHPRLLELYLMWCFYRWILHKKQQRNTNKNKEIKNREKDQEEWTQQRYSIIGQEDNVRPKSRTACKTKAYHPSSAVIKRRNKKNMAKIWWEQVMCIRYGLDSWNLRRGYYHKQYTIKRCRDHAKSTPHTNRHLIRQFEWIRGIIEKVEPPTDELLGVVTHTVVDLRSGMSIMMSSLETHPSTLILGCAFRIWS